jgi:hypothetical protein
MTRAPVFQNEPNLKTALAPNIEAVYRTWPTRGSFLCRKTVAAWASDFADPNRSATR